MQILPERNVEEIRLDAEGERFARLSLAALYNMHDYGVAFEGYLRWHGENLRFALSAEADLFEGMKLSRRLTRVVRNTRERERHNERLRAELLRRQLDGDE